MSDMGSLTAVRWARGVSEATSHTGWIGALPYLLILGLACLASAMLAIADPLTTAEIFGLM